MSSNTSVSGNRTFAGNIRSLFFRLCSFDLLFPLTLVVLINGLVYWLSKVIAQDWVHHYMGLRFDEMLPFCPFFIVFYFLAYVQWGAGYLVTGLCQKDDYSLMCWGDILAKLICFLFFLVYPTVIDRPEITGSSVFDLLTKWMYSMDTPVNLFPSIHCLESWICCRFSWKLKGMPLSYKIGMTIFSLLVFASTVLLRQHVLVDIAGGIAVCEIGILAARFFHLSAFGDTLMKKIHTAFSSLK